MPFSDQNWASRLFAKSENEMEKFISVAKKWLRRIAMAYMLGFANAINQEVKMVDDTFFKTEEVEKDNHD